MKISHTEDYRILRKKEYPAITEYADAVYWQSKGDSTRMDTYLAKIEAVKLKYPKPP